MRRRKRIAIFAEKLYNGGVEKILQIVLRNLDLDKYDITLYSHHDEPLLDGCYPTQLKHRHIYSHGNGILSRLHNKLLLSVYYHCSPRVFYRLFIGKRYDLGIAFIEGYATRYLAGAPRGMKKIAWVHCDLNDYHWTHVAYPDETDETMAYETMDRIITVAQTSAEAFRVAMPSVTTPLQVIYNPIESDAILAKSQEPCALPPLRSDVVRLVTAGRFSPPKKLDRLLRIVNQLITEGYAIELWMLGDGALRPELELQINQLNLGEHVKMLGFKANPYPYIKSCDIYVSSSIAEGFATAITESLILGIPVVTTEVSGAKEQLGEHNEWGIVTDNDEQSLYHGLKRLLDDPELLCHYRRQAALRGRDFTLDKSMADITRLLDE